MAFGGLHGWFASLTTMLCVVMYAPLAVAQLELPPVVEEEPIDNLEEAPLQVAMQQPLEYALEDDPGLIQNAPDAYRDYDTYRRTAPQFPSYYFNPAYYNTPDIGARALPDYAPGGYEPRDYQDAPGVPEFSRITTPVRVSTGSGNYVTQGMFPGSFLVPGSTTSFRFRGFARLMALGDFNPIGSTDAFVPNTIPVPQEEGRNFNVSARMSRFGLESWTPTTFRDWNVHTFIEGDFFNGPAQAAGGGGNPFRLRHAFVDFGIFRFGQQNSAFMDAQNWPSLVDFNGPNGWINQRQPSLRMTLPLADRLYWATAMERPFSDITTSGLGTAVQEVPDFSTHLRFEATRGHLQVSSLLRSIGYRPTGGETETETGVGVSGSAVIHPWAMLMCTDPVHDPDPSGLTRSRMLMQCTWGPGIGRYVQDLVGQGLDGQVNPITGEFELVDALGWNASYEHWFNASWLCNTTYSQAHADDNIGQPGTTYESGTYLATSLWWLPIPRLSCGIEYLWGERVNFNGQSADANRIDALLQYNF